MSTLPARRRIYLVRHADVRYFEAGRPLRPDGVALTPEGLRQAEALAGFFRDLPLDRAVASDLPRTLQTAAAVLQGRSHPALETLPGLREIRSGRLDAIPVEDRRRVFLEAFGVQVDRATTFLGGESFGALADRVLACLSGLLADPNWRHLLVVAHGGVNRVILTHALGAGLTGVAALEQDPACVNVLDVDDAGRFVVWMINFTPYNPTKSGHAHTTMERLYAAMREGVE
jgi:probable phosphoglycerate mutase